jgi:DNA ligase-1
MNESQMTLCTDWEGQDPTGWLVTEKLDGCRAYWDGTHLWTREGNVIDAPRWFTAGLPADDHIEGELWAGRGRLDAARFACQHGGEFFNVVCFRVSDCPTASGTWSERMATARRVIKAAEFAAPVAFWQCKGLAQLALGFYRLTAAGGEGVVLRSPTAVGYEHGRSKNTMRLKLGNPFIHLLAEAIANESSV